MLKIKFKFKFNIKKVLPFIVFFIIIFAASFYMMMNLKEKVEKELHVVYSKRLEQSKGVVVVEKKQDTPLRQFESLETEELNEFLVELKQRIDLYKKKIDLHKKNEKEIDSFKADLEMQKKELVSLRDRLSTALTLVSQERIALNDDLITFSEIERKNLAHLSTVYASMDAVKAAEVLSQLNSETGAKVISGMPPKKSAKILMEVAPVGAAKLTEQLKKLEVTSKVADESLKQKNLKKLAAIYQSMEADKAVSIIEELDEETTVSILAYMAEKKLAKILELVESDRALELTEKIRNKTKEINKNKGA